MTFETFDQSDEQKDKCEDKYIDTDNDKYI